MGSRRDVGLMVALIAIVALLAVLSSSQGATRQDDPRASTFLNTPQGTRALYLALAELGIRTDRRLTPYADADSIAGPLALLAPTVPPTPAELHRLASWVREGGSLLYAATPGDPTLDSLGLRLESLRPDSVPLTRRSSWKGRRATPTLHRLTLGLPPVDGFRWAFHDSSAVFDGGVDDLMDTSGGDAVVVLYRM
ncbi:MAG: DUF4350 domain-containing protein, partial [Gemmatimonadetes bacterium]|nr:DUF4350 domain-containing protein [Gemmatimonadota bacterium]